MDEETEVGMGQVIRIGDGRIRDHLGEMLRGTVEKALNARLDAEAPRSSGDHRAHVWIGCGVTILPGIMVGDDEVIGTGAAMSRDVAPYDIVGGVPGHLPKCHVFSAQVAAGQQSACGIGTVRR